MSLQNKGQIREELCSRHKYFEWDLDREFFDFSQYLDVTSPVFKVDQQSFYLEGPAVKDTVYAWYSGVICFQGSDEGPVHDGRVNISEELSEWTDAQRLFTVSSSYLHNSCLRPDAKITFFFRINVIPMNFEKKEIVPYFGGPCNHGTVRTSPTNTGSIVEREWEMSKKVQWNIPCKSIKDSQHNPGPGIISLDELLCTKIVLKSPVFEILNQRYYFCLEIGRNSSPHYICLYRLGPPIDITARWWLQMKNGSNYLFLSRNMNLNRACVGWTYNKRLVSFEELSESSFTVEFLLTKVDIMYAYCPPYYMAISCGVMHSDSDGLSPLDKDPSRTEFISFRAQGHDFTVHRSLLRMRVPVFEAMLSHDTVENRTGVVRIDDCEPVVVGMFLHYVDTGFGPIWNLRYPLLTLHYTAALFVLADKYLLPELRDICLTFLNDVAMKESSEFTTFVADKVEELKDILSTFPPELLKKWYMINFLYHYTPAEE